MDVCLVLKNTFAIGRTLIKTHTLDWCRAVLWETSNWSVCDELQLFSEEFMAL